MQIIIDIPEQIYLNAKTEKLCGAEVIVNAIKNGTPLPKGHGRLIDAEKLKETMDIYLSHSTWSEGVEKALIWCRDEFIDDEPTIIEAERKDYGRQKNSK